RFFEVTAFDVTELPSLRAAASRTGKFHGQRQAKRGGVLAGGFGEHNYHMRIREEKHRHYANVADHIYQIHTQRPLTGLVVAGIGVDAAALVPHLHTYLHDLVLGVVKLNPKKASAPLVREAALLLRDQRERAWEQAHAEAVKDGLGTGWAVNGIDATLKALSRGPARRRDGSDLHRPAPDARDDRTGGDPGRRGRGRPLHPVRRAPHPVPAGAQAPERSWARRRARDGWRDHPPGRHGRPPEAGD